MESEVMKGNNEVNLQKPPKIQQKEREACSSSSSPEIQIQNSVAVAVAVADDSCAKPHESPAGMDGYDPNRIPASVFSSKAGAEWSAASNESLFSIQMGNTSFSNDYAIMYGTKSADFDLNNNPQLKSGELPRLDERSNNNRYAAPGKSTELSGLAPVMEQEEGSSCLQSGESSRVDKKDGSSPYINHSPAHDHAPANFRPPVSPPPANPRISDVSGHSNRSFAFPVLTSDSGKKERSIKVGSDKNEGKSSEQAAAQAQPPPQKPNNKWLSCFFCCPR